MKPYSSIPRLLVLSERIYRALLVLYPADFRHEYGELMTQVFRDSCRDLYRQGKIGKLFTWWAVTLFDLLKTALAEHRKERSAMSQDKFIQWSGWFCIIGSIFFAASSLNQLQPGSGLTSGMTYQISLYALVPGMAFIMLGLLGILLRFKEQMNLFGRLSLLTSVVGAGITSVGWMLNLTVGSSFWNLFMVGWVLQLVGQSVFGGFAVTTRLLPRWNFVLLIGSVLPLTVIAVVFQQLPIVMGGASFAMIALISIGWLLTGWALHNQPSSSLQTTRSA